MGICKYCGQSAGILRKVHSNCEDKNKAGWAEMIRHSTQSLIDQSDLSKLGSRLAEIAGNSYIPDNQIRIALIQGWVNSVDYFLEDGVLDKEEELRLAEYMKQFNLAQQELDHQGAYSKLVKSAVIRDLVNGIIPQKIQVNIDLPFNLQKTEQLIWVFQGVQYYEDKTQRQYVGSSQGVSIKIVKGVYYRVGAFRGQPVERTERVQIDTGFLGITSKHLYFAGPRKSVRVRHDKIISFIPYSDGVGIQTDGVTAKPKIFVTGDGWFTYNLLSNISCID
jgi:hypothetical protein